MHFINYQVVYSTFAEALCHASVLLFQADASVDVPLVQLPVVRFPYVCYRGFMVLRLVRYTSSTPYRNSHQRQTINGLFQCYHLPGYSKFFVTKRKGKKNVSTHNTDM